MNHITDATTLILMPQTSGKPMPRSGRERFITAHELRQQISHRVLVARVLATHAVNRC